MTAREAERKYFGNIAWCGQQVERCAMDEDIDGVETQLDYLRQQIGMLKIIRQAREEMA